MQIKSPTEGAFLTILAEHSSAMTANDPRQTFVDNKKPPELTSAHKSVSSELENRAVLTST
jgi:hypothetical protein